MASAHAIFVSLKLQTMRGYVLKKSFDMPIGHFWTTAQNHIFKTLTYLEQEQRVEKKFIEPEDQSNRKQYSIIKTGRPNRAAR